MGLAHTISMAQKNLVTWYDAIGGCTPVEVTSELYYTALEVMPPVYATGCFGVGEAHSHDNHGYALRHWFAEIGGKFYGYLGIKSDAILQFGALRGTPTMMDNYREYNKGLGSMGGPL
jgi:hypothetical protein